MNLEVHYCFFKVSVFCRLALKCSMSLENFDVELPKHFNLAILKNTHNTCQPQETYYCNSFMLKLVGWMK